jgi:RNA-directed DNA polymerase
MSFPFDEYRRKAEELNHSPEFIGQTIRYASKLDEQGLPVIFSLDHFALQVGMPILIIDEIIQHRFNQYTRYRISKKNDSRSFRYLMSPDSKLRYTQKWMNQNILQKVKLSNSSTAYSNAKTPYLNAKIHDSSEQVLRIDLLKFFDTITEIRIQETFEKLGYTNQLAKQFALLTTTHHNNGFWNTLSRDEKQKLKVLEDYKPAILPQGAPSSPQLSNIVAQRLDIRLEKISKVVGCRYSRYADDMIFSTKSPEGSLPNIIEVGQIINEEGFIVNEKKTKIFKKGMRQYVTGFTVTHGTNISKKARREIFTHLYYSKKFGPYNHLRRWMEIKGIRKEIIYNFQGWLFGKISFVLSVDGKIGGKMLSMYNTIDWALDAQMQSINVERSTGTGTIEG